METDSIEIICRHCGCDNLVLRGDPMYHNHAPWGRCYEEIYECDLCGEYTQFIWRLREVHAIEIV
jgi:hypothetical protein